MRKMGLRGCLAWFMEYCKSHFLSFYLGALTNGSRDTDHSRLRPVIDVENSNK